MTQRQLREHLDRLVGTLDGSDKALLQARLKGLASVFPFSEYEYMLMFLLDRSAITFQEYEELRKNYVSSNRYLELYELAPRVFGQVWGEQHVGDLDSRLKKANPIVA